MTFGGRDGAVVLGSPCGVRSHFGGLVRSHQCKHADGGSWLRDVYQEGKYIVARCLWQTGGSLPCCEPR